jgi:hypothetical protein
MTMAVNNSAAPVMAGSAIAVPRPKLGLRFATSRAPAAMLAFGHRTVAEIDAAEGARA